MKLNEAVELQADIEHESGGFTGRKYRVVDTRYGHDVSEHDFPGDAEKAARARPFSKVVSTPNRATTPALRDMARSRMVKTSPDVD